jgi:Protein of unknown function (DUF4236)
MVRYRRSKKVGPFRVTVSQRGISTSAGAGPLRISHGADGKIRRTVRVPGTGIYDTRVIGGQSRPPTPTARASAPVPHDRPQQSRPSTKSIALYGFAMFAVMAALFSVPIYWLFTNGLWPLAVGGTIGLIIGPIATARKWADERS